MRIFSLLLCAAAAALIIHTPTEAHAGDKHAEVRQNVDWTWNNHNGISALGKCMKFILGGRAQDMTGHDCVHRAVKAYRGGSSKDALWWLKAGQCHNKNVRNLYDKYTTYTLEYLHKTYDSKVPKKK